jgi:succinyl-diaminopimelate desuccinylase
MNTLKEQLVRWIDEDRNKIIDFLCDFVRAKSPNPPGDTTLAAAHVASFLEAHQLPFRIIAPQPTMPNIVGSFAGPTPGRHLVLNGHMDVFPVDEQHEHWTQGPWSGAIADGKVYGRGVADMKAGTSASVFTYYYLYREHLKGRLTLTAVSDEETFGPWGARYLMEHHPEVHGDCLLNGEPSSPLTMRFGEKGPLWLKFTVRTSICGPLPRPRPPSTDRRCTVRSGASCCPCTWPNPAPRRSTISAWAQGASTGNISRRPSDGPWSSTALWRKSSTIW